MNPLDVPFHHLKFCLNGARGNYQVRVRHLCWRSLHRGVLEFWDVSPVDFPETLVEMRDEELSTISKFTSQVRGLWGRSDWTLLTPIPAWDELAFQTTDRIYGRLCAAVLQSYDPFPVPYEGEKGPEPADYAEACVIYLAACSEGLLPQSARALIRWEEMARPCLM
jgi:hypothetical protein